jgi:hypothetical protein
LILLFLPESPKWLYEKKEYGKCYKVINYMAKMNGKPGNIGRELLFIEVEENEGVEILNPSAR